MAGYCCSRLIMWGWFNGAVAIWPAQLAYLLSGIDWWHSSKTWRPTSVGWRLVLHGNEVSEPLRVLPLRRKGRAGGGARQQPALSAQPTR